MEGAAVEAEEGVVVLPVVDVDVVEDAIAEASRVGKSRMSDIRSTFLAMSRAFFRRSRIALASLARL